MSPIIAVAVVAVAIFAWDRLTIGLTYLAREAKILSPIRNLILSWDASRHMFARPKLAEMIACGQCTSAWTGLLAFLLIFPAVFLILGPPWWIWIFTPLSAPAGTGTFDRLSRMSTARAVEQATAKILKTLAAGAENDGEKPTERTNA